MSGNKKKTLQQLDGQINFLKNQLNCIEGKVFTQYARSSSPQKQQNGHPFDRTREDLDVKRASPLGKGDSAKYGEGQEDKKVIDYVKYLKKLQHSLQQKINVLETESQKKISSLEKQMQKAEQTLKEKESANKSLEEELNHYRKESVKVKEQNKQLKADNKIIMNQIDRLTQHKISAQQKQEMIKDRQLRVMQSLYRDSLDSLEDREKNRKTEESTNQLSNRMKLQEANDRNGQLKSLIRRLNQQNSLLKTEKDIVNEQNRQKTLSLENQKQITKISEQTNTKLNEVIQKMGQKIANLEQINQTLRSNIQSDELTNMQSSQNYYIKTKSKVGQFYYKR